MGKAKVFNIVIKCNNSSGDDDFHVDVSLPLTTYELIDVMDKARITADSIYSIELIYTAHKYLWRFISPDTNLYELNHFAVRISELSQWELDCFKGMVMMDSIQTKYAPITVEFLINMTFNTGNCQIVYDAHNDASLGKFYVDNEFVPELDILDERMSKWIDYAMIGKEMREAEGGVFTPHGYVVQNGEIMQTYQSGNAIPKEKPDYTILLRIEKKYFNNNSKKDKSPFALLKLPTNDMALFQAMKTVGASSQEECVFSAEDCMVPSLTEKISVALCESERDCYSLVNEFAQQLKHISDKGNILTYKAMMEIASEDITIEDAFDLSYNTESFSVIREVPTMNEYARSILSKYCIEYEKELFESTDLYNYGKKIMMGKGVFLSEYGVLWSLTGHTVEPCLNRHGINQGMEMK